MTSSPTLKFALLGAGRIARKFHLPILSTLHRTQVIAIAETDARIREVCRRVLPQATLFSHYKQLLDSVQPDAVVICLPPDLHAEAAIAAFEKGLHVYMESPLATTQADGERVIRAWHRAGSVGWIGFNYRFHSLVIAMREALQAGKIGDLLSARTSFYSVSGSLPARKHQRQSGDGALPDMAGHDFDLLRFVLQQDPVEVSAQLYSGEAEDDSAAVQLRLESGQLLCGFTSVAAVERHRVEITGTNGEMTFDRHQSSELRFNWPKRDFSNKARLRSALDILSGFPHAIRDSLFPPKENSFEQALSAFVDTIEGFPTDGPDLSDGLYNLMTVLAAERSTHSGKKETIDRCMDYS